MSGTSGASHDAGIRIPQSVRSAAEALRRPVRHPLFRVFRAGLREASRGLREGDRTAQMIGASLLALRVYREWKRHQKPVYLYGADLDVDESIGIRLLRKGVVVGEFPVGSPRE